MRATPFPSSAMRGRDVASTGVLGLRSRPGRSSLTALGIAIGIAALFAVIGISASSRADLVAQLDRLGTNLLQVSPGQSFLGDKSTLPVTAPSMIRRIGPVQNAAAVGTVSATVRRSDRVPSGETGLISVSAVEPTLLETVQGRLRAPVGSSTMQCAGIQRWCSARKRQRNSGSRPWPTTRRCTSAASTTR